MLAEQLTEITEKLREVLHTASRNRPLQLIHIGAQRVNVQDRRAILLVFRAEFVRLDNGEPEILWYEVRNAEPSESTTGAAQPIEGEEGVEKLRFTFTAAGQLLLARSFYWDEKLKPVNQFSGAVTHREIPPQLQRQGFTVENYHIRRIPVRYIPGNRLLWRYEFYPREENAPSIPRVFFAKTYRKKTVAERVFANTYQLEIKLLEMDSPLLPPHPIALLLPLRTVWFENASGSNLLELLPQEGAASAFSQIARGLSLLHQLSPHGFVLKDYSLEKELVRFQKAKELINRATGEFREELEELEKLLTIYAPGAHSPMGLVHGTFRANHLIIGKNNIILLDADSVGTAPPEYDVANFLTALHFQGLRGKLDLNRIPQYEEQFLKAYLQAAPGGLRSRLLNWYLSCLFIRKQATKILRQGQPGGEEHLRYLFQKAVQTNRWDYAN